MAYFKCGNNSGSADKVAAVTGVFDYTSSIAYGTISIDVTDYSTIIVQKVSTTSPVSSKYGLTIAGSNFQTVTYRDTNEHEIDVSGTSTLTASLDASVAGYVLVYKIKFVK